MANFDSQVLLAYSAMTIAMVMVVASYTKIQRYRLEIRSITDQLADSTKQLHNLRFAVDQSAIIAMTDHLGVINYVNKKFEKISGYTSEEIRGKTHRIINSGIHDLRFFENLWAQIKRGQVWQGAICNRSKKGELYWVDTTIIPIDIIDGSPTSYISIRFDITDKVAALDNFSKQSERMYQMQKLEAVGTLANGIAHDFNNILQCFTMGIKVLRNPKNLSQHQSALDDLELLAKRGKDLVRQVLTFSRKNTVDMKAAKIEQIIAEATSMMKSTLPANVSIKLKPPTESIPITCDETRMLQVIINLCTNAAHAMKEKGGEVTISWTTLKDTELPKGAAAAPSTASSKYCCLSIQDQGPGISDHIKDRVFEPFFTTKPVGVGTGMGLSVVHGIISEHRGVISLQDAPSGGALFLIYLPVSPTSDEVPEKDPQRQAPSIGSAKELHKLRILFVDDDLLVKKFGTMVLEDLGFLVDSFSSAQEALEKYQQNSHAYELVITDLTMPGMNGLELGRRLKETRNIPVILATGNLNLDLNVPKEAADSVINKPFVIDEIKEVIALLRPENGHGSD